MDLEVTASQEPTAADDRLQVSLEPNTKAGVTQRELPHSRRTIDQILDEFEGAWAQALSYLQQFARRHQAYNNQELLSELVRVDLDLRYSHGGNVDLEQYFELFPSLREDSKAIVNIAFEDFRARRSRGLPVSKHRWQHFPQVHNQEWFRSLNEHEIESHLVPRPGEHLGDFELLMLLGRGAFSEVYLGRQENLAGRYVALKITKQTLGEADHLARLQHTGIVPIYSLHKIGEYSVLCMPYAGAATLADWLRTTSDQPRDGQSLIETLRATRQRLTQVDDKLNIDRQIIEPFATFLDSSTDVKGVAASNPLNQLSSLNANDFPLWFALRIASALAHAHQRGIVHGDIKPANILIRNDGEPALIDFNLSQSNAVASQEFVGGTLPYMAPEQLQSLIVRKTVLTSASDVFSFGVTLFELLEGRYPFPVARSTSETDLCRALEDQASTTDLAITNKAVTNGLRAIILKCLSLDQEQRYPDANTLLEDLEREQACLPLKHTREGIIARSIKLAKRYPTIFSTSSVGALFLVFCMLIVAWAVNHWRSSQKLSAQETFARLLRQSEQTILAVTESNSNNDAETNATHLGSLLETVGVVNADQVTDAPFLQWLSPGTRSRANEEMFAYCLSTALLLREASHNDRLPPETQQQLQTQAMNLLGLCQRFPDLASRSLVFEYLLAKAANKPLQLELSSLKHSPSEDPFERLLLARLALAQGQHAQVTDVLVELPEDSPHRYLFWLTLGESQLRMRHFSDAKLTLTLALSLAPRASRCFKLRAEALLGLGDLPGAIADYESAIAILPHKAALYADRARVLDLHGKTESAIVDLNRALQLAPTSNRFLLYRSSLYQRIGKMELATKDRTQALRIEPETEEDWIYRALALADDSPSAAIKDLEAALELNPQSLAALQNKSYIEAELLNDTGAAIETLNRLLALDPEFEMALGGRCVLLARQGMEKEALADITKLSQRKGKILPATRYQIGCALSLLSNNNPALRRRAVFHLSQAIQQNYGLDLLTTDKDLAPMRDDTGFKGLVDFTLNLTRPNHER